MGDRAIILIRDCQETLGVGCYLHWQGNIAIDLLEQALPRMRQGDASYSMARFIGHCHNEIEGNLSLGCFPVDTTLPLEAHADGDAGAILYNCSTGEISCAGGYLSYRDGENIGLPAPG